MPENLNKDPYRDFLAAVGSLMDKHNIKNVLLISFTDNGTFRNTVISSGSDMDTYILEGISDTIDALVTGDIPVNNKEQKN